MAEHGQDDVGGGDEDPASTLVGVERLAEVGHWQWDVGSDRLRWSRETARVFGVDEADAPTTYEGYLAFLHADDRDRVRAIVSRAVAEGGPFAYTHRLVRADGDVRVVECRGDSTHGGDGSLQRLFGIIRDVTVARQADEALRRAGEALAESESRFRQIAEHMSTGLWLFHTESGRYLYVNPAYSRITGQTVAELDADPRSWREFVHPEDRAEVARNVLADQRRGFSGYTHEHRIVTPEGVVRWVRVRSDPVRDEHGTVFRTVGSMEDVTALRTAEAALRVSETRFRRLAEGFPYILWVGDAATGTTEYVNPAYARIFGRPVSDLYADPRSWLGFVHPQDRPMMEAELDAAAHDPGSREQEYRIVTDEGEVRWMRWLSYPLADGPGEAVQRVAVVEEITDRRMLADELLQAQKMHAVGRLAGGVAHDFNNMLLVILNHVDEALTSLPPDSLAHEDLRLARQAAERVSVLTDQLLTFSRRRPVDRQDLDLAHEVRQTARMLGRTLGSDVEIRLDLPESLPPVPLDPAQLQQVVVNLAVNARDAMPSGGVLTMAARPGPDPRDPSRRIVALRVSDDGEGMPSDVAARALEPFFTTKPVGRGSGLGLSMVYGIAEQHGGHVLIDSTPGGGSTVSVLFPVPDAPQTDGPPVPAPDPRQRVPATGSAVARERPGGVDGARADGAGRTVLVVEDSEEVRRTIVRVLSRGGYTTAEAASPGEAIRMCHHQVWAVDLLVTDLVMPGMSGQDLVSGLAELGLHPPVVFVSGYAQDLVPGSLDGERTRFLQKPFRGTTLLAAAADLLVGDGVPTSAGPGPSGGRSPRRGR